MSIQSLLPPIRTISPYSHPLNVLLVIALLDMELEFAFHTADYCWQKSLDHSWCPFDHQLESYQWACCYSHPKQTIVAALLVIVELSLIICYVTSPNSLVSLSHQDLSVHSHGGCYVRCWEVLDPSICLMMLGSHQKVVSLTSLTESRVQGYGLTDLVSTSSNSLSNHYTLARWWKY